MTKSHMISWEVLCQKCHSATKISKQYFYFIILGAYVNAEYLGYFYKAKDNLYKFVKEEHETNLVNLYSRLNTTASDFR